MKIYANGCSFVLGQELVDNDPLNMENMRTAFPAQLNAHNDAWSGSSNAAIANRTIDYCRRENPDVAIVGWTHYERVNCFEHNHERKDRLGQTTIKPSTHEKMYLNYFMNEEMLEMETRHRVEGTYHILKSMGIEPVFFFSFNDVVDVDVPMLWDNISWNDAYEMYTDWDESQRIQQHPDQAQHDWLAQYLKNYISKL